MKQESSYIAELKSLVSISLLITFSFSILGIDLGIHKCGGEVKSIALFSLAKPCSHAVDHVDEVRLPTCHSHLEEKHDDDKGCCEDEYHDLESLIPNVIPDNSHWEVANFSEFCALIIADDSGFESYFKYVAPHYLNYKPPLIVSDAPSLLQVFLI